MEKMEKNEDKTFKKWAWSITTLAPIGLLVAITMDLKQPRFQAEYPSYFIATILCVAWIIQCIYGLFKAFKKD